ncbi:MAG: leucine-rich repeat protein [Finegoldia sp.]|nr:leucine-rich repeat protein [Finegoldia sp.]
MKKHRKIAFLLAVALLSQPISAVATGFTGDNLVYAANEESDFVFDEDSGYITGYKSDKSELVIPESINGIKVKGIGKQAFASNKTKIRLTSLSLPEGLEVIEDGAFFNNDLTSVSLPSTVKSIGKIAFASNTKLEKIDLNEGLENIGQQAFLKDSSLSGELLIPSSLDHLFTSAFKGTNIESIRVYGDENSKRLVVHSGLGENFTRIDLENPYKPINVNFNTFAQDSLINAGKIEGDFASPEDLKAYLEENINIKFVATYVNKNDSSGLNDIELPLETVWNLENFKDGETFYITGKMKIDPNMEIPNHEGYTSPNLSKATNEILINLQVTNSNSQIVTSTFDKDDFEYGEFSFKSSMEVEKSLYGIVGLSESGKEKLSKNPDLAIDTRIENDGKKIQGIGRKAFEGANIRSLSFENLESDDKFVIMDSAFENTGLEEVNLPDGIFSIESNAFKTNKLKNISLPKSLVKIGNEAFKDNQIENLSISDDVVDIQIDNYSFANNKLSLVKLPYSIFKIRDYVFMGNLGYEGGPVRLETRNPEHLKASTYIVAKNDHHEIVLVSQADREALFEQIKIGNNIIREDYKEDNLESFDQVLAKAKEVFSNEKSSQEDIDKALDDLVKEIASLRASSSDRTKLRDIISKAKALTGEMFTEDTYSLLLEEVAKAEKLLENDPSQEQIDQAVNSIQSAMDKLLISEKAKYSQDDFVYDGKTIVGFSDTGKEKYKINKDLVLPDKNPDGDYIEVIGEKAFEQEEGVDYGSDVVASPLGIKSVKLPEKVKRIEASAFRTNNLTNIDFPESLEYVGDNAFNGNQLEKIYLPDSVREIGMGSFSLNQITELRLSNNMTEITNGSFSRNIKLEKLTIPEGIKSIGQSAFMGSPLKEIKFPKTLEEIGRQAFASHRLESLTIPGNVKKIGKQAFEHNKKFLYLKELRLEEGIEEIGEKAFRNSLLAEVKLPKSIKTLAENAFEDAQDINKNPVVVKLYTENPDHLKFNTEKSLVNQEVILIEENTNKEELENLQKEIDKLKEENKALQEKQDKLEKENKEIKEEADKLQKENQDKQKEIENENKKLQEQIQKQKEQIDKLEKELTKTKQEKLDSLEKELNKARTENKTLKENQDKLQKENQKLKEDLQKLETEKPGQEKPSEQTKVQTTRIAGENRYQTAIEISKQNYKQTDTVIIASGENYPDALTATVLAHQKQAPILLTHPNKTKEVEKEIQRLQATNIIIIGKEKAVTKQEEQAYKKLGKIERIGGENRYQTAIKIAEKILKTTNKNKIIVASGQNYPDALAIGSYAAKEQIPIILAENNKLPEAEKLLENYQITEALIIGGEKAVGNIEKHFTKTDRIAGNNRYQTAVKIAENYYKQTKEINLTSGENYPDALVVNPVSAKRNIPVILNTSKGKEKTVEKYLQENKIEKINIYGGKKAIEEDF